MTMIEMFEEMGAKFEALRVALEDVDLEVNGHSVVDEYNHLGYWRRNFQRACEDYDYLVTELGFKF